MRLRKRSILPLLQSSASSINSLKELIIIHKSHKHTHLYAANIITLQRMASDFIQPYERNVIKAVLAKRIWSDTTTERGLSMKSLKSPKWTRKTQTAAYFTIINNAVDWLTQQTPSPSVNKWEPQKCSLLKTCTRLRRCRRLLFTARHMAKESWRWKITAATAAYICRHGPNLHGGIWYNSSSGHHEYIHTHKISHQFML